MKKLILTLIVIFSFPVLAHAKPLTLSQLIQATCRISTNGGKGTGTVIKKVKPFSYKNKDYPVGYFIMSNRHVVGNNQYVNVEFFQDHQKSSKIRGEVIWRRYHSRQAIDVSFIYVSAESLGNRQPIVIPFVGGDYELERGTRIRAAGCAQGTWPRAWEGIITIPYESGGASEFLPASIPGDSGTGITVDIPDDNGELQTRVAVLLAWDYFNNELGAQVGSGISNKQLDKIFKGQVSQISKIPDYYREVKIKSLPSTNKYIQQSNAPKCKNCGCPKESHRLVNGELRCPIGGCDPWGGGGENPNPGENNPPAPWPGDDDGPGTPTPPDNTIEELKAKIAELTAKYNEIKDKLEVTSQEKNKLIIDIVALRKQLEELEGKNTNLNEANIELGGKLVKITNKASSLEEENKEKEGLIANLKEKIESVSTDIQLKLEKISNLKEKLVHPFDNATGGNGIWLERLLYLLTGTGIGYYILSKLKNFWQNSGKEKFRDVVDRVTDDIPGKLDDIVVDKIVMNRIIKYIDQKFEELQKKNEVDDKKVPPPMFIEKSDKYRSQEFTPGVDNIDGYGPVPPKHPAHIYTVHDFIWALDEFGKQYRNDSQLSSVPSLIYQIMAQPKRRRGK